MHPSTNAARARVSAAIAGKALAAAEQSSVVTGWGSSTRVSLPNKRAVDGSGPLGFEWCGHSTTARTTIRASRPAPAAAHGHSGDWVGSACVGAGGAACGWAIPKEDCPTVGDAAGAEA